MTIVVNGDPRDARDGITVRQLLESLDIRGEAVAVEVNEDVVARANHDRHTLAEGDRIEIVTFVGGG